VTASVTYVAVLDLRRETILFLSGLLHTERRRRGTRTVRLPINTSMQVRRDFDGVEASLAPPSVGRAG
jgi:hypothetical protein